MPYKDPEKRKEAQRKSQQRRRSAQAVPPPEEEQEQEQIQDIGGRPVVEDAEAAYGDANREAAIIAAMMRRYNKASCWAFIIYEDSVPADYEDKLRMLGVQFALSPWHDADIDRNGKRKKNHRHGILHWPTGSTTYKTAASITRDMLHGTIPVPLVSPRGYYRYFTHADNPKKAQYDEADIITGNGFDVGDFLELTSKEKAEMRQRIIELVMQLEITEYSDLVIYCMYNESMAAFDFVSQNTLFFATFLRSWRFRINSNRLCGGAGQERPEGPGVEISEGNTTPNS